MGMLGISVGLSLLLSIITVVPLESAMTRDPVLVTDGAGTGHLVSCPRRYQIRATYQP